MLVWLACAEAVAELTRFDFNQVFSMPAMEFFTYLSYINYKRRKQDAELKKINARYGRH